jgi:hypothetical protein
MSSPTWNPEPERQSKTPVPDSSPKKPFKSGRIAGTEFRYTGNETVQFINRVFIVGKTGYQLMGSYADPKDEAEVTGILDSFRTFGKQDW